jgi:hypothetical protein
MARRACACISLEHCCETVWDARARLKINKTVTDLLPLRHVSVTPGVVYSG